MGTHLSPPHALRMRSHRQASQTNQSRINPATPARAGAGAGAWSGVCAAQVSTWIMGLHRLHPRKTRRYNGKINGKREKNTKNKQKKPTTTNTLVTKFSENKKVPKISQAHVVWSTKGQGGKVYIDKKKNLCLQASLHF